MGDKGRLKGTAKASDVLMYKTGICHAKANLLAALPRSQCIPTGFRFQRITLADDESMGYCVHCYNTVWLGKTWGKLDARGNTNARTRSFLWRNLYWRSRAVRNTMSTIGREFTIALTPRQ